LEMQSEEEISEIEHFCHEAVKHFGLVLVCEPGTSRCKVSKHLDNGSLVDCWFTWVPTATQSAVELSYPAIFSSVCEVLYPLLVGMERYPGDFAIQMFFWRDENSYDFSTENPFLGCKSVYEAMIKLDLMKG